MTDEPAAVTAPLPVVAAPPRRRRRRWPFVLLAVVLVLAAAALIGLPVADSAFRAQAERQIASSIESGLPSGVRGQAVATIHGGSALRQYLAGRFDDVTVAMTGLTVDGRPATASAEVHGLPVDGGRIGDATIRFGVDAATVRALAPLSGTGATAPQLGEGTVSTTVTQKVLALPVVIRVVLKPALSGAVLVLRPSDASVKAGFLTVPVTAVVQALYPQGIRICTAQYLPPGVRVTALAVHPSGVAATLSAADLDLATLRSGATGRC